MQLAGQVAIITGGSKGIGRAIAAGYAEEGASVVIVARTEVDVETAASEIRSGGGRAIGIAADVSSEADVDAVVSRTLREFGQIDVLVNNAGAIHPRIATVDLELDTWRRVLDVNMTGAFLCARSVLPHMYERGSGKVINISSIGGRKGAWGRAAYRASKAGRSPSIRGRFSGLPASRGPKSPTSTPSTRTIPRRCFGRAAPGYSRARI